MYMSSKQPHYMNSFCQKIYNMSSRWSEKETEALIEVRKRLKDQLASRPQYPDGKILIYP